MYRGKEILGPSELGLEFRGLPALGPGMKVSGTDMNYVNESWERVWGRNKKVKDHYDELIIHMVGKESRTET